MLVYSKEELLNFKNYKHKQPSVTVGPVTRCILRRQRGQKGGVRRRNFIQKKVPVPAIVFGNVRSIVSNIDDLAASVKYHHAFKNASAIGICETWLESVIGDDTVSIDGYDIYRADRDLSRSGKQSGGGIAWYINRLWCTNVSVNQRFCSKDLELLHLVCRPHYLPREINVINLIMVYIPPHAHAATSVDILENIIDNCNSRHPDAATIITGDFNHVRLKHLNQYVNFNTRLNSLLDLCYSNIEDAYKAVKLSPIGNSDHHAIQLVPTYIAKHKRHKISKTTKYVWDNDTIESLKTCFETTDWSEFVSENLDYSVELVSDYINFCVTSNVKTKEFISFANSRPWLTREIKETIKQKNYALKAENFELVKSLQKDIKHQIAASKINYKNNVLSKMSSNIKQAWQGIKTMSHLNGSSSKSTINYPPDFVNNLNTFYCRFERNEPESHPIPQDTNSETFTFDEVYKTLSRCKSGKAAGPDNIQSIVLSRCASELTPIFHELFNKCVNSGHIPTIWKKSEIVPVPKKTNAKELNDFRPIALTSVIMKCFEHLIKNRLISWIGHTQDDFQFAYKQHRSTKDACAVLDHLIREHVDTPGNYARVLFIDYSSAFNTISPSILVDRLTYLGVPNNFTNLISSFLHDRQQYVRIGVEKSDCVTTNTGCPQGCVLSPLLFSIYTDGLVSNYENIKVCKYADDTAVVGLLSHKSSEESYTVTINNIVQWCYEKHLQLNSAKTKEIIVNFSKNNPDLNNIYINDNPIEIVDSFKYLGVVFSKDMNWNENSELILSKLKRRFYAYSKFCSFHPSNELKQQFVKTLILPILMYNIEVWFPSCTEQEKYKLLRPFKRAGFTYDDITALVEHRTTMYAKDICRDSKHILNKYFVKTRKTYLSIKCRTSRYLNGFLPSSIRTINKNITDE